MLGTYLCRSEGELLDTSVDTSICRMIGRVAGLAAYGAGLNTLPLVGLQGIVSHMFDADVDVAALVGVISTVCMWA
jgi:hypothetical protein